MEKRINIGGTTVILSLYRAITSRVSDYDIVNVALIAPLPVSEPKKPTFQNPGSSQKNASSAPILVWLLLAVEAITSSLAAAPTVMIAPAAVATDSTHL